MRALPAPAPPSPSPSPPHVGEGILLREFLSQATGCALPGRNSLCLASQDQFRGCLTNLDNRGSKSAPGRQTILEAACTRPMQTPSQ